MMFPRRRRRPGGWDMNLDTPTPGPHMCGMDCATWAIAEMRDAQARGVQPHECSAFFRSRHACPRRGPRGGA